MRLLFIALRSPFSGYSGNGLILQHHLRQLHARHEIDLVAFGGAAEAAHPDLKRLCRRVRMVPAPTPVERRVRQCLGLFSGLPLRVGAYASAVFQSTVDGMVKDQPYDAAVVQLCEAAQFCPNLRSLPCVMDFEDPPSIKLTRTMPWLESRARRAAAIDLMLMPRYEERVARMFDRLVFVSASDARAFGEAHQCGDRVAHVHHAVDSPDEPTGAAARVAHAMVVSGNMAHPPNVAAVAFVCGQVFPLIRRAVPDAQLWLVGADPGPAVRKWAQVDGITVTGAVPDVRAHVSRAQVALCGVPVVIGAQTKILEALSCGTPVVTTSAGNYGIEAEDGRDLYLADTPELFAARTISVLHGERWAQLAAAGRQFVRSSFSPAGAAAQLERVIAAAIDSRRSSV